MNNKVTTVVLGLGLLAIALAATVARPFPVEARSSSGLYADLTMSFTPTMEPGRFWPSCSYRHKLGWPFTMSDFECRLSMTGTYNICTDPGEGAVLSCDQGLVSPNCGWEEEPVTYWYAWGEADGGGSDRVPDVGQNELSCADDGGGMS